MSIDKRRLLTAIFGKSWQGCPEFDDELLDKILSPRERFVIEHRFGKERMTLEDLGKICPRADGGIGIIRERVRQVEAKALRKLRHPVRSELLLMGHQVRKFKGHYTGIEIAMCEKCKKVFIHGNGKVKE